MRWVGFTSFLLMASSSAWAAAPTRGLTPVPENPDPPVALQVALDQKEARIGSTVQICFSASRTGFATLWDISTANQAGRIFPNQFTKVGTAASVEGGKRYCAGTGNDPFRFRVDAPTGTEDLFLLWTTKPELQPPEASYPSADALVGAMGQLGGASGTEWASAKVTFDIVPAAGPPPVVVPPPPVSGNVPSPDVKPPVESAPGDQASAPPAAPAAPAPAVWIFAMGANVDQLTKTNQDATVFTKTTTALFAVPPDHVRLIENGTNADWMAGMDWLAKRTAARDFVFIYFSGHGGRFKSPTSDDGWDEFLVPYDFENPDADVKNLLFSQKIAALINRLPTKNVVTVVDACHSAGVYRSLEAGVLGARGKFYRLSDDQSRDAVAALDAYDAELPRTRSAGGRNRIKANGLLLAASRRDQNALESSRGGFFTNALTQEMTSKAGGNLDAVFARATKATEAATRDRQDPEAIGDHTVAQAITFD